MRKQKRNGLDNTPRYRIKRKKERKCHSCSFEFEARCLFAYLYLPDAVLIILMHDQGVQTLSFSEVLVGLLYLCDHLFSFSFSR
jgi:hypothetical protein